ncbi:MAG: hypothetical protein A3J28_16650 [Acidobacteria bacterium RIFCSPLOWO2_12_FULL_60_22]|nr:MAG: hypothetical protein A3J28_16650 [Acidobacteria bacterium RIFCSPLOWO2_12_FULL_60_22]
MRASRSERGAISFSTIVGVLVFAALIFLALKLLPPFIDNYQFQESITNLARTATYAQVTEADIRKDLMKQAQELGIPLQDKQVVIQKGRGTVDISVRYAVEVDLIARKVVLDFQPSAGNRNIVFR